MRVLWEFNQNDQTIREVSQLVITTRSGGIHHLRIQDWMKDSEQVRKEMAKLGLGPIEEINVFADPQEQTWIEHLVAGLGGKLEWLPAIQASSIGSAVAEVHVTDLYFRAIAKIGFHYVVATLPDVRGAEDQLKPIRDFIKGGGAVDHFVFSSPNPIIQLPICAEPNRFIHVVTAEWHSGQIDSRVQLFLGPGYRPAIYKVRIGSHFDLPTDSDGHGHSFAYFPDGPEIGFYGEAERMRTIACNSA